MKIEHCQKKSIGKNIIEVQFFLMLIEKIFDKNKIVFFYLHLKINESE